MDILIIDDDLVSRKKLQKIMEMSYECQSVDNGREGLEIALSNLPPKLILLDITMPDMDGFEVCKILKSDVKTEGIPIIFLTAHVDMDNLSKGFTLGAADYITKPFQKVNVMARVKTQLMVLTMQQELSSKNVILKKQVKEIEETTKKLREKDLELLKMDRMTGIGTFAAGIAHEINNPLNILQGDLFLLKRDLRDLLDLINDFSKIPASSDVIKEIENLKNQNEFSNITKHLDEKFSRDQVCLERIKNIVQELRQFSFIDTQEITILNINKNIETTLAVTSKKMLQNVTIKKEFAKIPNIPGNGREINQAFSNIVINALQAMNPDGILMIKTSSDNEHFFVTFKDNGKGMSQEVLKQAFNPFFTTREVGSGTGIGLSIAEKIVKRHGGDISIESEIDKGTEVSITFPISNNYGIQEQ